MSSEQCPFCAIVTGDDPDVREVYRNEHVVAFFPTEPAVLGHVLVVPRRHVEDIWGLRPEESAELSTAALFLASALRSALLPEGLNVIQSNGDAATQTVPHLHVHLVPRRSGDAVGPIWPSETDYTQASKDDALRRVIAAVQSTPPLPAQPELSPEDRRKHLDYIQAVVTRQSAASSSAKGWLLPVTTAAFGFALTQHLWPLALLGVIAVILFAYLDANYLRSEKAFRKLYNTVARAERMVPRFTLDPTDADEPPVDGTPEKTRWQKLKQSYVPEWSVWRSWSIAPFYVAMLVLGVGVLIAAAVTRPAPASTRDKLESPPTTQTTVTTSVPIPANVPVPARP
ncbi:HIT family protein [Gordonia bronchialis]|uniref:HIT family protein n=1 Tax=Gordonia bronchialis TaxID=2054 RepID=UPI001CC14280|nr:HIT family protein [Gordonia bronchialis]UAK36965.1 HIT family protein [Gordonia bronchialis]